MHVSMAKAKKYNIAKTKTILHIFYHYMYVYINVRMHA